MKAAILKAFGSPLAVETLPDPVLGTGEVIVDVVAAPILSYADEIFSGADSDGSDRLRAGHPATLNRHGTRAGLRL